MSKVFEFYKTCRWVCPNCHLPQNGIINKLQTQYYLQCCRKTCQLVIEDAGQIAELANLTIGYVGLKKEATI